MRPYIICLMVASIDGRKGETSLFDGITNQSRVPVQLRLEHVKRLKK